MARQGPGIGFIGHMDTVFPVGTAQRRPFTVDRQADRVYGPGVAAHAGRDYANGASAILALARKVLAYDRLVDLPNGVTVNTGLISGGSSANSVAPWAEARLHLTYRRLADGERVVAAIRDITAAESLPHTRATASGGLRLYPLERTAAGDRLFALVREAGRLLDMPLEGQHYESAAESGFCSSVLGIPTICCMGPEGEHIHSDKEYLVLSSLVPRAMLLALSAVMAARTDLAVPVV